MYHPIERQVINNFYELSMREAYRVDLRNGSAMAAKIEKEWGCGKGMSCIHIYIYIYANVMSDCLVRVK